ncbi:hypothetical protein ACLMJK_000095 [Lecanora helva]
MAYVDTPRTEADATYLTNGHNLENFSVENSFLSPLKGKGDLASHMRNGRGTSFKTPRSRVPFTDRRNLPTAPGRGEFTPLLQSVAKKNLERNSKLNGVPETPAFLKASYKGNDSPALPGVEASALYGSDLGSSVLGENDGTPVPQVVSSSIDSTPLAALPKKDATGVLTDQGNVMTLREQENIINKIEKENFGLKLKIHFLEESLRKAGPGFNEAALRENTDLKVDKITIQKELARCRKNLSQAERDVESYKRHVEDKKADESLRQEVKNLRSDLARERSEAETLRQKLDALTSDGDDVRKLKDDIEDLEAEIREKDRVVDERDEEIDRLKSQEKKDADEFDQVCNELEAAKEHVKAMEYNKNDAEQVNQKLADLQEELHDAWQAKESAEEDLNELRDEMSNKSFTTKGLSRQLEDKANKLQDDLGTLREKYADLEQRFDDRSREVTKLQDQLHEAEQDADVRDQRLKDQNELLRHDKEAAVRRCEALSAQLQQATRDLESKSEEKDLLHSRHDALTIESQTLQKELSRARSKAHELDENLENERRFAQENDRRLRSEAKVETDRLSENIHSLERKIQDRETENAAEKDRWEGQRRSLLSQKEKAEEQAKGLQRTIDKLQEVEGTLSGRETKLLEALESEKQRHRSEEASLERQLQDLDADIDGKRRELESVRSDLSQAKEGLRVSQRAQVDFEEKIQALEDEVDVLQNSLDEEGDKARDEIRALEQEIEDLNLELAKAKDSLSNAQHRDHDVEKGLETRPRDNLDSARQELQQSHKEKQSIQDRLGKLQGDVDCLQKERKDLLEKTTEVERQLEQQIKKATSEEARLTSEITRIQNDQAAASGSQDRELAVAKQKAQRLEARLQQLELQSGHGQDDDAAAELSLVQNDLRDARKKEAEYIQRETAQKAVVRDLKQKISRLERQHHELEVAQLATDSPRSSVGGSARKSDLVELQRQLTDAHHQAKEARRKSSEELKTLQRRLADSERLVQSNSDNFEQEREKLEAELASTQNEQETLRAKNDTASQTITRLRTRISSLEKDIRMHRQATTADNTIAEERRDLHEMLKDAKLTAEDLQVQITAREGQLTASSNREKDLRTQLKRVREERTLQTQKCGALSSELDNLQTRYEKAVDNLARRQRQWEDERKAMASKVRFANTSMSELHQDRNADLIQKHAGELRGLAKQIQWLRAKCTREQGFRSGLMYEKKFLLKQIEMFEACNSIDLNLLSEMGIDTYNTPSLRLRLGDSLRGKVGAKERKRPSLRAVGFAIIAGCRMKKMSREWAGQKRVREALGRKLEGMVEGKKGKRVSGGR